MVVFIHVAVAQGNFVDHTLGHLMNSVMAPSFHPGLGARGWLPLSPS